MSRTATATEEPVDAQADQPPPSGRTKALGKVRPRGPRDAPRRAPHRRRAPRRGRTRHPSGRRRLADRGPFRRPARPHPRHRAGRLLRGGGGPGRDRPGAVAAAHDAPVH
ncbi:hypothetical protein ADK59_30650 [Streptomyces sp. XY332]|nr:hypothetical protein ADK59_30650 [Streptomyces sp. XY332]